MSTTLERESTWCQKAICSMHAHKSHLKSINSLLKIKKQHYLIFRGPIGHSFKPFSIKKDVPMLTSSTVSDWIAQNKMFQTLANRKQALISKHNQISFKFNNLQINSNVEFHTESANNTPPHNSWGIQKHTGITLTKTRATVDKSKTQVKSQTIS